MMATPPVIKHKLSSGWAAIIAVLGLAALGGFATGAIAISDVIKHEKRIEKVETDNGEIKEGLAEIRTNIQWLVKKQKNGSNP